jgi:predicted amidohydrolase YtcJ
MGGLTGNLLGQRGQNEADLVLRNGKIVTMDAAKPEAEAIAVRGHLILAVGSNLDIQRYIRTSTKMIDLAGKLAVPGFIEGHGHFLSLGESKETLDLTKAKNWDEIVSKVQEAVWQSVPGKWIIGRGWHQEKWDKRPNPNVEGFPTHQALTAVSLQNPVLLAHASGHALVANARAMELSGITKKTADPAGGEIVRDSQGNATGAFRETAQGLIRKNSREDRTPQQRDADSRRWASFADRECLSKGITSFQDAGSSLDDVELYQKLFSEGALGIRLWVMVRESNDRLRNLLSAHKMKDFGDHHLTLGGIKKMMDGALGSRGAWLLEPYTDDPGNTGLNVDSPTHIREAAQIAFEQNLQLCVHSIGDRANRKTLNIFEAAFRAHSEKKDWRWRVEHISVLHPDDIPRFGRLAVIASMQGYFCPSDARYVAARLGRKRCEDGVYVWQKLLQSGAIIVNGSDAPVEDVSPLVGFHASVTRQAPDGTVFYPSQRMTRQQALRSYTLDAANAAFEEEVKGSLTAGKVADITVLSRDIMTIPEPEILTTKVVYTIVDGKVAYKIP